MSYETFKIVDSKARDEWERLLGHEIHSDVVRVTREKYLELSAPISAIQMDAAFRVGSRREPPNSPLG